MKKRLLSVFCIVAMLINLFSLSGFALEFDGNLISPDEWRLVRGATRNGEEFTLTQGGLMENDFVIPESGNYKVYLTAQTNAGENNCFIGLKYRPVGNIQEASPSSFASTRVDLGTHTFKEGDTLQLYVNMRADIGADYWFKVREITMVPAGDELDHNGNLLKNPGFENGFENWTQCEEYSGSVIQYNQHSGTSGFSLDGFEDDRNFFYQEVTVPFTGYYQNSVWAKTGENCRSEYGIRMADTDEVLASMTMPANGTYDQAHQLEPVFLHQGDKVEVYMIGRGDWVNGDDFSLTYDFTKAKDVNLLDGLEMADGTSQEIRLPWDGRYLFTASVTAGTENAEIQIGNAEKEVISAGETREVEIPLTGMLYDEMVAISITGKEVQVESPALYADLREAENHAPVASGVKVTFGSMTVPGVTLKAAYSFLDEDGNTEGESTYRWLMADSKNGEYVPIEGETAMELTVSEQLVGKYLKFEVTPVDEKGLAGTPAASEPVGEVLPPDADYENDNLVVNGDFEDGETGWNFIGKSGSNGSGIMTNNPHSGGKGFFLDAPANKAVSQVIVIPYTGIYDASIFLHTGGSADMTSQAYFGFRTPVEGNVIKQVNIPCGRVYEDGPLSLNEIELHQGDVVELFVNGTGVDAHVNGDDIVLAYNTQALLDGYNLLTGTDLQNGAVSICAPRNGSYRLTATIQAVEEVTVQLGDVTEVVAAGESKEVSLLLDGNARGDKIPVSVTGNFQVTDAALVYDVERSQEVNEAPSALNVQINQDVPMLTGQVLNGSYVFSDPDKGQKEGDTTYRWLMSTEPDGEYVPIDGAEGTTLTLTKEMENRYLRFEVTPKDDFQKAGEPVLSDCVGPVVINWITDFGFEMQPSQWQAAGSASVSQNSNPRNGSFAGVLTADENDALSYTFTAERSDVYSLYLWAKGTVGASFTMGIYEADGTAVEETTNSFESASGYTRYGIGKAALTEGKEYTVKISGNTGASTATFDDLELVLGESKPPVYANILTFTADHMLHSAAIDPARKTVSFWVPYGTDVTALKVETTVSDGAEISPVSGTVIDFSGPVEFTVTNGDVASVWTATCVVRPKSIILESDNTTLRDGFNKAVEITDSWVATGREVPFIKDESIEWDGTTIIGKPSYWGGYNWRSAYYIRDYAHQVPGASLVGLQTENFEMLKAFAKSQTESRQWFSYWSINFDNETPLPCDYKDDNNFMREIPAMFELVDVAYQQYRWTGDERYVTDPVLMNFYSKVMNEYIEIHDQEVPNGIPEGDGVGTLASYNERWGENGFQEASDAVACMYAAYVAYGKLLEAAGEQEQSAEMLQKAEEVQDYFINEWSVMPGDEDGSYVVGYTREGVPTNRWNKETGMFILTKKMVDAGTRTDKLLDMVYENYKDGTWTPETAPGAPDNPESFTYAPDVFFPYNQADRGWHQLKYNIGNLDIPYPEISFTVVSATIEGLMGIEPDAANHTVSTLFRHPEEINQVKASCIQMGEHELAVEHNGPETTSVTNTSEQELTWNARFYGNYDSILVNGVRYEAQHGDVNGVEISYAVVPVAANETVTAQASNGVPYSAEVVNGEGSGEYFAGDVVTVKANEAEEGMVFDKWTADNESVVFENAESEETTFVMPEGNVVITANYRKAADKTLLQKTYDYALMQSTEGVTDAAKKVFEDAVAAAKAVLDNTKATQDEVNTAWRNLVDAIHGLGVVQGDKTNLGMLIEMAEAMDESRYVETNWPQLVEALAAAKSVMEDGNALEEDIQKAADNLLNAILAQRLKANKDNLEDLIQKANEIDVSQYTAESVAVFQAALKTANLVLEDETLSEDDQDVVDKAASDLNAAIENLSVKDDDTSKPDDGNNDTSKPDDGKGDSNTSTNDTSKPDAPATGDTNLYEGAALVMVLSITAIGLLIWKRRRAVK